MSKSGEYEVGEFLRHLQPSLTLYSLLSRPDKRTMERIAQPGSEYVRWQEEQYAGDYTIDHVVDWLHAMKEKHSTSCVSILDYGDSFGVEWEDTVAYTEKQREEAREWLLDNPEEPGETIRFRRNLPFDVPKFEE